MSWHFHKRSFDFMGLPAGRPSGSAGDFCRETLWCGGPTLGAEPGGALTGSAMDMLPWAPSEAASARPDDVDTAASLEC